MTTPTGQIGLSDVNTELGYSSTATITMNDTAVRTLAGVSSGAISMDNLRGKSNRVNISYTFSSTTQNASINLNSIGGYSAGKSNITININSGVYLYATSTGNYGLSISGGTSGDTLAIVNNGYIMGQGGVGGAITNGSGSGGGGPAMNLSLTGITSVSFTNGSGYIGGGGGGAGAASGFSQYYFSISQCGGGGGAGGGAGGGGFNDSYGQWTYYGGAGGGPGQAGSGSYNPVLRDGYGNPYYMNWGGGGGGGRILPGSAQSDRLGASGLGGTAGGSGAGSPGSTKASAARGGGGGGPGQNGQAGQPGGGFGAGNAGGGGGGWGASGGSSNQYGGSGGGKAINLNGATISWVSGSAQVYGAVS